jgi:hypothetical protein
MAYGSGKQGKHKLGRAMGLSYLNITMPHQEEAKIRDLDGMLSQHPPKIVGVGSECQES